MVGKGNMALLCQYRSGAFWSNEGFLRTQSTVKTAAFDKRFAFHDYVIFALLTSFLALGGSIVDCGQVKDRASATADTRFCVREVWMVRRYYSERHITAWGPSRGCVFHKYTSPPGVQETRSFGESSANLNFSRAARESADFLNNQFRSALDTGVYEHTMKTQ